MFASQNGIPLCIINSLMKIVDCSWQKSISNFEQIIPFLSPIECRKDFDLDVSDTGLESYHKGMSVFVSIDMRKTPFCMGRTVLRAENVICDKAAINKQLILISVSIFFFD